MTSNARELAQIPSTPSGRRNLITNGAMQVAQRGTSVTGIGASSGYFTVDRFKIDVGGTAGRLTMTQTSDGPSGFANCIKLDCTTADTSVAAGEFLVLATRFEGQDLQRFMKGTSDAKEYTVSFYVKGNASATYVCELADRDNSRGVSKTFAVTTGWTRVEITFPADTTGAFDDDNANSLDLQIWLHAGSTYNSGTLQQTWAAFTSANRAVGGSSFFDSTDRTFFITGVQLEVGSVATEFEHRSFGEELALCQRYFQLGGGVGRSESTSTMSCQCFFHPTMRVAPSITVENTSLRCGQLGIALVNITSTASAFMNTTNTRVGIVLNTSSTSLTAGQVAVVAGDAFGFSAEL